MRRSLIALALAGGLVPLAACSDRPGDDEAPTETAGLTPITVGVLPIVDTAPIWLGVDHGIFEEHGLDVDLELAQGGAAVVPAVVSGEHQLGFSNITSLLLATAQGLPLELVAAGSYTTGDTASDISAVVTMPGSGITSPADLAGRTVAVNTLNNIGDTTVRAAVAKAGGDPFAVSFVEMGFPDMPAAVAGGRVDAAWVNEPFLTISRSQGAQVVTHPFAELDPELLIAGYFTSREYAEQEPEVVEAFMTALGESVAYATEHPDETRAILSSYTEIDPAVQEAIVMPRYSAEINEASVETLAELALKYRLVQEPIDTGDLLP